MYILYSSQRHSIPHLCESWIASADIHYMELFILMILPGFFPMICIYSPATRLSGCQLLGKPSDVMSMWSQNGLRNFFTAYLQCLAVTCWFMIYVWDPWALCFITLYQLNICIMIRYNCQNVFVNTINESIFFKVTNRCLCRRLHFWNLIV